MAQWYPKISEYDYEDGILHHILEENFMGMGRF
ncbi:MAG: hypothetical protein CM15mP102_13350 [Flavobacteriales bacterium]|nr:MAG: hypothetical protein CM15mP102_13350 [Flavobacteriales bacterium]